MNTSVGAMYNDLQGLGVDVAELKLKANTAIAFMDNFLVIDRSRCKTTAKERTVLAHEAEPDPYATERLAAATLDFYHRFMQRPDAKELLERKKAELRARGVRLN